MRVWVVPLCGLVAGLALALATLAIDAAAGYDLVPTVVTGTPSAAQTLASTIVSSVVTLISVVLTVMTVAVQLAMGQFSPRIVRALLADRAHQLAFALFGATCVFGIVAMRGIDEQRGHVPGLTLVVLYLLALATLATLILYVSRAGNRLRASGLIDLVGDQLHTEIEHRFPAGSAPAVPPDVVAAPAGGLVVAIDADGLIARAVDADCVLELLVRMGDFVAGGAPLIRVHGTDPSRVADATHLVRLSDERTHDNDPAFGFRKLVDIATRSAGDDPTTTVEALHRIHDCMRQLVGRPFPPERHVDAHGDLRLITRERTWGDYVRLAFEEIRLQGAQQPQIARRLRAALDDLASVASPERRSALDAQSALLEAAVRRGFEDDVDVRDALAPDPQGVG